MAFLSIYVPLGLSEADRQKGLDSGPPAAGIEQDHITMLTEAGFVDAAETDVTDAYLETVRAWTEHRQLFARELMEIEGEAEFEMRDLRRVAQEEGILAGVLKRSLCVARR